MSEYAYVMESKLTAAEKKALPDSAFGLPSSRRYPLFLDTPENSESHIKDAISFFHFCPEENRAELAKNIVKAIKKYKLSIKLNQNSKILKYTTAPKEYISEKTPTKIEKATEAFIDFCYDMEIVD